MLKYMSKLDAIAAMARCQSCPAQYKCRGVPDGAYTNTSRVEMHNWLHARWRQLSNGDVVGESCSPDTTALVAIIVFMLGCIVLSMVYFCRKARIRRELVMTSAERARSQENSENHAL